MPELTPTCCKNSFRINFLKFKEVTCQFLAKEIYRKATQKTNYK